VESKNGGRRQPKIGLSYVKKTAEILVGNVSATQRATQPPPSVLDMSQSLFSVLESTQYQPISKPVDITPCLKPMPLAQFHLPTELNGRVGSSDKWP
jgi:hypothetical protein